MVRGRLGAFVDEEPVILPGAAAGPLMGLRFAAKDLFDVAGHVTGCGNPDWRRSHPPAGKTAPLIERLVGAGATMIGKTQTDELAYSLQGENRHYGTPVNVRVPDRIPGGSSSGSAVAVAGDIVHFSIGTDTGGSVRVPAAFCGVCGVRPSHGRIPLDGCMPLAPSFDTAGWFSRDARLLEQIGEILLRDQATRSRPARLLIANDSFSLCDEPARAELTKVTDEIQRQFGEAIPTELSSQLQDWMAAFRILQAAEVWQAHGDWVQAVKPDFGPGIRERFEMAARVTDRQVVAAEQVRRRADEIMRELLDGNRVMMMPTAPGAAPLKDTPAAEIESFRNRTLTLTCIAGMARLPQVSLPLATVEGAPLGLSLLAAPGNDMQLLGFARQVFDALT